MSDAPTPPSHAGVDADLTPPLFAHLRRDPGLAQTIALGAIGGAALGVVAGLFFPGAGAGYRALIIFLVAMGSAVLGGLFAGMAVTSPVDRAGVKSFAIALGIYGGLLGLRIGAGSGLVESRRGILWAVLGAACGTLVGVFAGRWLGRRLDRRSAAHGAATIVDARGAVPFERTGR